MNWSGLTTDQAFLACSPEGLEVKPDTCQARSWPADLWILF